MFDILKERLNGLKRANPLKDFLIQSIDNNTLTNILYPPNTSKATGCLQILNSSLQSKESTTSVTESPGADVAQDTNSSKGNPIDLRPVFLLFRGIKRFAKKENFAFRVDFYQQDKNSIIDSGNKDRGDYGYTEEIEKPKGHKPISTIFLGSNGVGKSSVFLALELAALQTSKSLLSRGLTTPTDQTISITNDPEPASTPWHSAAYIDKTGEYQKYKLGLPKVSKIAPAFFYTEEDYNILAKENCTRQYLARQMGIEAIYDLETTLQSIIDSLTDAQNTQLEIKSISENDGSKNKRESQLKRKNLILKFNETHILDFKSCVKAFKKGSRHNIEEIRYIVGGIIDDSLKELHSVAEKIIPRIFDDHLDQKLGEKLKITFNQKSPDIKVSYQTAGGELKESTPREYFNTFRFTLYVVALKIALAITVMKISNIIFPIVLDDVFDSTDFQNRSRLRRFASTLFDSHLQIDTDNHFPLQLILFTQDEIIADSTYHGIKDIIGADNVKLSRIFDYREAITDPQKRPNDISRIMVEEEEITTISIDTSIHGL